MCRETVNMIASRIDSGHSDCTGETGNPIINPTAAARMATNAQIRVTNEGIV